MLVDEQPAHLLPEAVGRDLLLPVVAGEAEDPVEAVQGGGAEGQGVDVVVLVREVARVALGVEGVQLVDAFHGLLRLGVVGAVVPPHEVVADGVLEALGSSLDGFAVSLVPQGLGSVAGNVMLLGSANRDPDRWDEPDRFDLTRDPSGHVGFGMGIHQCVGQHVARLEAETLLTALAQRVDRIELTGTACRHLNNTLRSWASLPVHAHPSSRS
ncbi:cytochrome P450 [Streptomyces sp. B21-083]|uniref:cytochrome P450 n=1 Tax=Streptomyces sp. B21-083 TaxID=3039410 RepID=UPI002FF30419